MRVAGLIVILHASACGFEINAGSVDAPVDGEPISCATWTPHHFVACAIPSPSPELSLAMSGTYTLNTSDATLSPPSGPVVDLTPFAQELPQAGGPVALLISVGRFSVDTGVTLRVVGDKPLIVASWATIDVGGTIDVTSHLTTTDPTPPALVTVISRGAGSHPEACTVAGATAGGPGNSGSGGGGGGGFQGAGGDGGRGDTGGPIPAGMGGGSTTAPSIVRGGCDGAISGTAGTGAIAPSIQSTTSPKGAGGGAVQLTARGALSITGTISAGGSGGGPAQRGSAAGGGGAGSGGFIGLEGATITVTGGTLAANGGGGGSSARFTLAERGREGQDGKPSSTAATGGTPDSTCSLQAPSGSAGSALAGGGVPATMTCDCGGAGGGGGAGFILHWGPLETTNSTLSPAALPGPS